MGETSKDNGTHGAVSALESVEAGLQVAFVYFGGNHALHGSVGMGPELVVLLAEQKGGAGGLTKANNHQAAFRGRGRGRKAGH